MRRNGIYAVIQADGQRRVDVVRWNGFHYRTTSLGPYPTEQAAECSYATARALLPFLPTRPDWEEEKSC